MGVDSLAADGTLDLFHLMTRFRCSRCEHRWSTSKRRTDVCEHGTIHKVPCAPCGRTWAEIDAARA